MNRWHKKFVLVLLSCLLTGPIVLAQAAFNLKVGPESWSLKDEKETAAHSRHPGQMIGIDAYFEKNRMVFAPGFHYHRLSAENEKSSINFDFSHAHHFHYLSVPLTVGYKLLDSSAYQLSVMAGGEIHFFYDLDPNNSGLDGSNLYGVTTALTGVIHSVFFSLLTADIRYHYSLQPIIKSRSGSRLRGWTFAIGVKF